MEHPYGTIKRQWGFSYILTKKGVARASSDVGFMFIAYNLRRIANIVTPKVLKEYLRILVSLFLAISDRIRSISLISEQRLFLNIGLPGTVCLCLKTGKTVPSRVNYYGLSGRLPLWATF